MSELTGLGRVGVAGIDSDVGEVSVCGTRTRLVVWKVRAKEEPCAEDGWTRSLRPREPCDVAASLARCGECVDGVASSNASTERGTSAVSSIGHASESMDEGADGRA